MKNDFLSALRLHRWHVETISILCFIALVLPSKSSGKTLNLAPANDDCSGAVALTMGAVAINGTLSDATVTSGNSFSNKSTANDIWYSFVATCTQVTVTISQNNNAGISFEIYSAASCPTSGSPIFYGNASSGTLYAQIASGLTSGTNYYIRVIDVLSSSSPLVVSSNSPITINISSSPGATGSFLNSSTTASNITTTTATLNGYVLSYACLSTSKGFVFSITSANSDPLNAGLGVTKTSVLGLNTGAYSLAIAGLTSGVSYSFKPYISDGTNYKYGTVQTFTTTSTNTDLSALLLNSATLSPTFATTTTAYSATVSNATSSVTVTATRLNTNATLQVRVNGGSFSSLTSGNASATLVLNVGSNTIDVKVTAQDGTTTKTYTITVCRAIVPTVSIGASSNPICSGTSVTFTATPTNGGTPTYQWQKGGVNISGATASTYTSAGLVNNDAITVDMISTLTCANPTTATSNSISMTVNALPIVSTSTVVHDYCQVGVGSITISVTGGKANYTIAACGTTVSPNPTVGQNVTVSGSPATGIASSKTFTGLSGNIAYKFTATDANGCIAQ